MRMLWFFHEIFWDVITDFMDVFLKGVDTPFNGDWIGAQEPCCEVL